MNTCTHSWSWFTRTLWFLTGCASFLAGCATPPPPPPPEAEPLVMAPVPPPTQELIQVNIKFEAQSTLAEDSVQLVHHKVLPSSSVVINVPAGLFEDESDATAQNQDFKTKDFFNTAEQQIEKVLIRNGFRVLSRSKFEAKLRSLRDEARCDLSNYRCLYSKVSPESQAIMDQLKVQLENSEITNDHYASEITKYRTKLQTASAGKRRTGNEKELTDISEVIRAAESGDIQADYILQINVFDIEQKTQVQTDLRHIPEIREFFRKHPGVKRTFETNYHILSCKVVGAHLNAKLVHVRTGEIAWIGEHQLNEFSSGLQNVTIELGSQRFVDNADSIRQFVNEQNQVWARQMRFHQPVQVPAFTHSDSLIPPQVAAGRCEQNWNISSETKTRLARQVAKELIGTIKVGN
jgi:hypothetical protein